MNRPVRIIRTLSLLGGLATLMFVYADVPQMVIVYKQADLVYRIAKDVLFYVALATMVVPHFIVGQIARMLSKMNFAPQVSNWFALFTVVTNIFFIVSLYFVNILNSLEKFDFNYFGYLTVLGLLLVLGWIGVMLYLLFKNTKPSLST
jgi:hypothetical protein